MNDKPNAPRVRAETLTASMAMVLAQGIRAMGVDPSEFCFAIAVLDTKAEAHEDMSVSSNLKAPELREFLLALADYVGDPKTEIVSKLVIRPRDSH